MRENKILGFRLFFIIRLYLKQIFILTLNPSDNSIEHQKLSVVQGYVDSKIFEKVEFTTFDISDFKNLFKLIEFSKRIGKVTIYQLKIENFGISNIFFPKLAYVRFEFLKILRKSRIPNSRRLQQKSTFCEENLKKITSISSKSKISKFQIVFPKMETVDFFDFKCRLLQRKFEKLPSISQKSKISKFQVIFSKIGIFSTRIFRKSRIPSNRL